MFDLEGVTVDSSTDNDQTEVTAEPDFPANETADFYLSFGDAKRCIAEVISNTEGVTEPDINTFDNDLDDLARLLGEFQDRHPQAKLWLVTALAKSTFGGRQAEENDHGIGLDTDPEVPTPYESKPSKEVFYYADVYRSLPTIETEGLDGGEREEFEAADVDPEVLGFNPDDGPQLPVLGDTRWPVVASSDEDVQAAIDLLKEVPDEPTTSETSEYDGEVTVEEPEDDLPEAAAILHEKAFDPAGYTVKELRKTGDPNITDVDDAEALEVMLEREKAIDNRSTAIDRIQERLNAVQGDGDEASTGGSRYASGNTEGGDDGADTDDEGGSSNTEGDLTKPEFVKMLMEQDGLSAVEAAETANSIFEE